MSTVETGNTIERILNAIIEPLGGKDSERGKPYHEAAFRRINAILESE